MFKKIIFVVLIFSLSGCATFWNAVDILIDTAPMPICDKDSAGTVWEKQTCLKYGENDFRWVSK